LDLSHPNAVTSIVTSITQLKEQLHQFETYRQRHDESLRQLFLKLNVDSIPDIEGRVAQMHSRIRELRHDVKRERAKFRGSQKARRTANAEHRARVRQIKEAYEAQQNEIRSLKQNGENQQCQCRLLEAEIAQLTKKLAALKSEHETGISGLELRQKVV
jgi:chromosome segregation ATPase